MRRRENMFYVVLRCIWYRQKTRGRSPTLGGRFPPKRKKSIDLETVVCIPPDKIMDSRNPQISAPLGAVTIETDWFRTDSEQVQNSDF